MTAGSMASIGDGGPLRPLGLSKEAHPLLRVLREGEVTVSGGDDAAVLAGRRMIHQMAEAERTFLPRPGAGHVYRLPLCAKYDADSLRLTR
jgi:hypothetical protein